MLRDLADDLLAVLLPGRCPGCGARGEPVCGACAAALPGAPPGRALPGVSWSVAAFAYEGVARELVARVKYRNERVAVKWLARRLAERLATCPVPFDTITWVPGSAQRCATRGVDHGALLARAVARECDATATQLLRRDPGPPQTGRPAVDRRAGPVLHASRARRRARRPGRRRRRDHRRHARRGGARLAGPGRARRHRGDRCAYPATGLPVAAAAYTPMAV